MIPRLLLAIVILVTLYLVLRWFRNTPPQQVSRLLKKSALYGLIALLIILAISGRLHWLFALLASLLPFVSRLLPLLRYVPLLNHVYRRYQARRSTANGATIGQRSRVETRFVRMTLDHDSGDIDGTILSGPLTGRHLSQLSLEQLLECWREWQRQDPDSARLLAAYLDRHHAPQWRDQIENGDSNSADQGSADMSEAEAWAILGLQAPVSRDDIIKAHRQLMQRLHPDRGGSDYLAAKINQAKDVLLKGDTGHL